MQPGKVILAGAGPGDPELITLKTLRYLQQADVVLADRLVSPIILRDYVRAGAEIIPVGKQCRKGASTPQEWINERMVHEARQGKLVVRLKGGDVSIFSNILDELEALVQHKIPYEIIPGITAALGAAAYSGMPLTARNFSTAVRFLTYYKEEIIKENYWKELAQTDDTLVFYMSAETLPAVVAQLKAHGIAPETGLAIIEQATTTQQQVTLSSIYGFDEKKALRKLASPSLVIIGKVVQLQERFAWLQNANGAIPYFPDVTGKVLNCPDTLKNIPLTA
jgi:uroporphyrin-III C-methyltransferase